MELTVDPGTWLTLGGLVVATFVLWFTARRNERETRRDLKADIADLRTELKTDIADLRTELKTDIARLDDRVYALAARIAPSLPEPAPRADA